MTGRLSTSSMLALALAAFMLAGCSPTHEDGDPRPSPDENREELPERDLIEDPPVP